MLDPMSDIRVWVDGQVVAADVPTVRALCVDPASTLRDE